MMRSNDYLAVIVFLILLYFSSGLAEKYEAPRIISLAPHITEIIYKLDAGELLIGRTDFCNFPVQATQVESVGGYLNIDFEKVVRLNPDLIMQFPNTENRRKLEGLGYKVLEVPNETIEEIMSSIKEVGESLNRAVNARTLSDNIQDTLSMAAEIRQRVDIPVPAILVVGRDRNSLGNLYLAGSNTYLSELWELCGGKNAFSDVDMQYFSVNEEDLLRRDIKVILEFHPGWSSDEKDTKEEQRSWKLLNQLEAVEADKIYIFTDRYYVIPGPRITQIAISFKTIMQHYLESEQ